jgi:hypothetical protein
MTFTTLTVQLSTHTLLSLVGKLRRRGGSADLSEAIADAVDFWLADPARFEPGADQFAQSFARATRNAWTDLYVRRPCDKNFTLAGRLRQQLADEAKACRQTPPQTPPAPPEVDAAPPPATIASSKELRNTDREPGWDLPERRKFRYRLEDVAY